MFGQIIVWVVFGLIVGAIARLLYPGRQPMGILATIGLGILGSLLGGLLAWALGLAPLNQGPLHGSGWILSILGALALVAATLYLSGRGSSRPT